MSQPCPLQLRVLSCGGLCPRVEPHHRASVAAGVFGSGWVGHELGGHWKLSRIAGSSIFFLCLVSGKSEHVCALPQHILFPTALLSVPLLFKSAEETYTPDVGPRPGVACMSFKLLTPQKGISKPV